MPYQHEAPSLHKGPVMFPQRAAPVLFGLILTSVMTFFVTFIATWRVLGFSDGFAGAWIGSWLTSWAVAFPIVLVFAPFTRKLVAKLVRA